MDRFPVHAAALVQAKEHCRTCPECAAFVRAQLVAKQAPLPAPPADLADRVMAAVRAEAAAKTAAKAQAEAQTATHTLAEAAAVLREPEPEIPVVTLAPPKPRTWRVLPRPLVVSGIAAAMLIALVGVGGIVVFGIKQMDAKNSSTTNSLNTTARSQAEAPTFTYVPPTPPPSASSAFGAQGPASGAAAAPTASDKAAAAAGAVVAVSGPQDITVGGVVYTLVGPSDVGLGTMHVLGTTKTSLGSGSAPIERNVYVVLSPETVYVTDDTRKVFAFARATRTYLGLTYLLTAADLTDFGQWPALPSQIEPPKSPDGQPTFTFDGTEPSGVSVYRLTNSRATEGIAVAPTTDASGPAANDPNWTWWAIKR